MRAAEWGHWGKVTTWNQSTLHRDATHHASCPQNAFIALRTQYFSLHEARRTTHPVLFQPAQGYHVVHLMSTECIAHQARRTVLVQPARKRDARRAQCEARGARSAHSPPPCPFHRGRTDSPTIQDIPNRISLHSGPRVCAQSCALIEGLKGNSIAWKKAPFAGRLRVRIPLLGQVMTSVSTEVIRLNT